MTLRTSTLQGIELHLRLAKIGAGGKPLVGDSLRTLAPHEKNLSTTTSISRYLNASSCSFWCSFDVIDSIFVVILKNKSFVDF